MANPREFLYISDLDGTLLTPNHYLPIKGVERLNRLIEKGLKFTVATARNYDSVYPILRNLKLELPVILFNGVYLTEFHTGHNLDLTNSLNPHVVEDLMAVVEPFQIDPFVYTYNERHIVYYRNISNSGSKNYVDYVKGLGVQSRMEYVHHYKFLKNKNVPGMLFIDTYKALEPLHRALNEKYSGKVNLYFAEDISHPEFFWLQIFHPWANKGYMVKKLAKRLNISLEHTVVFGDYLNDLDMFEIAGRAIAVGNALPEVKRMAHEVIGENTEFAVIKYLEDLFSNLYPPED